MQTTNDSNNDTKLSAIDRALAAAKARKAAREGAEMPVIPRPESIAKQPKAKKETHPGFAKTQKSEALKLARDAAKKQREEQRTLRKAEKEAAKASGRAAHMKKVDRAAERLPSLASEQLNNLFNEVTTNFSAAQVAALALHLQHFNRVKATERALSQRIETGSNVRIVGGDPKYIGKTGVVSKAQRIRCYVEVPGVRKPVYLFTSDVELQASEAAPEVATGTEG